MSTDFFTWDDEITSNGSNFTTLMPGTYEGVITGIEKGRWQRSGEMFNCPYAEISITVADDGNGKSALVKDNLFLSRKAEFKIAGFLMALGLKKKDEPIRASKIDQAKGKNVKVVVTCQYKDPTTHKYVPLNAEQAANALEEGTTVFNNVKRYEPSEVVQEQDDGFSYNFDQFGYQGN